MAGTIRRCWVVRDEWGLDVRGVYADEASAEAVARGRLNRLVRQGRWSFDKQLPEVLASMVEEQPFYDLGMGD